MNSLPSIAADIFRRDRLITDWRDRQRSVKRQKHGFDRSRLINEQFTS
jgi:hypothetical protein